MLRKSAVLAALVALVASATACTPDTSTNVGHVALLGACNLDEQCAPGLFCGYSQGCELAYQPSAGSMNNRCKNAFNCGPGFICDGTNFCQPGRIDDFCL